MDTKSSNKLMESMSKCTICDVQLTAFHEPMITACLHSICRSHLLKGPSDKNCSNGSAQLASSSTSGSVTSNSSNCQTLSTSSGITSDSDNCNNLKCTICDDVIDETLVTLNVLLIDDLSKNGPRLPLPPLPMDIINEDGSTFVKDIDERRISGHESGACDTKSICSSCQSEDFVVNFCPKCCGLLCTGCATRHYKLKPFRSHKLLGNNSNQAKAFDLLFNYHHRQQQQHQQQSINYGSSTQSNNNINKNGSSTQTSVNNNNINGCGPQCPRPTAQGIYVPCSDPRCLQSMPKGPPVMRAGQGMSMTSTNSTPAQSSVTNNASNSFNLVGNIISRSISMSSNNAHNYPPPPSASHGNGWMANGQSVNFIAQSSASSSTATFQTLKSVPRRMSMMTSTKIKAPEPELLSSARSSTSSHVPAPKERELVSNSSSASQDKEEKDEEYERRNLLTSINYYLKLTSEKLAAEKDHLLIKQAQCTKYSNDIRNRLKEVEAKEELRIRSIIRSYFRSKSDKVNDHYNIIKNNCNEKIKSQEVVVKRLNHIKNMAECIKNELCSSVSSPSSNGSNNSVAHNVNGSINSSLNSESSQNNCPSEANFSFDTNKALNGILVKTLSKLHAEYKNVSKPTPPSITEGINMSVDNLIKPNELANTIYSVIRIKDSSPSTSTTSSPVPTPKKVDDGRRPSVEFMDTAPNGRSPSVSSVKSVRCQSKSPSPAPTASRSPVTSNGSSCHSPAGRLSIDLSQSSPRSSASLSPSKSSPTLAKVSTTTSTQPMKGMPVIVIVPSKSVPTAVLSHVPSRTLTSTVPVFKVANNEPPSRPSTSTSSTTTTSTTIPIVSKGISCSSPVLKARLLLKGAPDKAPSTSVDHVSKTLQFETNGSASVSRGPKINEPSKVTTAAITTTGHEGNKNNSSNSINSGSNTNNSNGSTNNGSPGIDPKRSSKFLSVQMSSPNTASSPAAAVKILDDCHLSRSSSSIPVSDLNNGKSNLVANGNGSPNGGIKINLLNKSSNGQRPSPPITRQPSLNDQQQQPSQCLSDLKAKMQAAVSKIETIGKKVDSGNNGTTTTPNDVPNRGSKEKSNDVCSSAKIEGPKERRKSIEKVAAECLKKKTAPSSASDTETSDEPDLDKDKNADKDTDNDTDKKSVEVVAADKERNVKRKSEGDKELSAAEDEEEDDQIIIYRKRMRKKNQEEENSSSSSSSSKERLLKRMKILEKGKMMSTSSTINSNNSSKCPKDEKIMKIINNELAKEKEKLSSEVVSKEASSLVKVSSDPRSTAVPLSPRQPKTLNQLPIKKQKMRGGNEMAIYSQFQSKLDSRPLLRPSSATATTDVSEKEDVSKVKRGPGRPRKGSNPYSWVPLDNSKYHGFQRHGRPKPVRCFMSEIKERKPIESRKLRSSTDDYFVVDDDDADEDDELPSPPSSSKSILMSPPTENGSFEYSRRGSRSSPDTRRLSRELVSLGTQREDSFEPTASRLEAILRTEKSPPLASGHHGHGQKKEEEEARRSSQESEKGSNQESLEMSSPTRIKLETDDQVCPICGHEDPPLLTTGKISINLDTIVGAPVQWTACELCATWYHDNCVPELRFKSARGKFYKFVCSSCTHVD